MSEIKFKALHNIIIEGCRFQTRLRYNINTNHIGIDTRHQYQNPNKTKEYQNKNKDKRKKYNKNYYKDNKEKIIKNYKEYRTQYYLDNCDLNTIRKGSLEQRIMVSCQQRGIPIEDFDEFISEKSYYCSKFNNECKESNRNKYDRKCFICNKTETENGQKLSVHHINMNKLQGCNNYKWKLVPLCQSCHQRCHNDLWQNRLEYLLNDKTESL